MVEHKCLITPCCRWLSANHLCVRMTNRQSRRTTREAVVICTLSRSIQNCIPRLVEHL